MPFAGTQAITELWANIKSNFGRKVDGGTALSGTTQVGYSIKLKNANGTDIANSAHTVPHATTTAPGVMSAADKAKLDGIASGATALSLGDTSTTAYYGDKGKLAYEHSKSTHAPTTSKAAAPGGTELSLVTTGEKAKWNTIDNTPTIEDASSPATGSATNGVYVDSFGVVSPMTYSLNKTVPSDAVFTDHVTTATTSGSGNAVTAVTADANGALSVTKGTTFLTSHQSLDNYYTKTQVDSAISTAIAGQGEYIGAFSDCFTVTASTASSKAGNLTAKKAGIGIGDYMVVTAAVTVYFSDGTLFLEPGDMVFMKVAVANAANITTLAAWRTDANEVQSSYTEMTAAEVDAICV